MPSTWFIESGVYGAEIGPFAAEIRRQGHAVELLPHRLLCQHVPITADRRPLAEDATVIGYGTFPFVREIQVHRRWRPGAWCKTENLDCSAYYPRFGDYLLNRRHEILSGIDAIAARNRLFDEFGRDGQLFIRPSSCNKHFVGRLTDCESFADDLAPARFDPACRVVVAAPQSIGREWRLIVILGRVVAGSQYAVAGAREDAAGIPHDVRDFAERVLTDVAWNPDVAFMLDIGEAAGQLWVVELNGFSTSWLYAADYRAVVAAAAEAAERS